MKCKLTAKKHVNILPTTKHFQSWKQLPSINAHRKSSFLKFSCLFHSLSTSAVSFSEYPQILFFVKQHFSMIALPTRPQQRESFTYFHQTLSFPLIPVQTCPSSNWKFFDIHQQFGVTHAYCSFIIVPSYLLVRKSVVQEKNCSKKETKSKSDITNICFTNKKMAVEWMHRQNSFFQSNFTKHVMSSPDRIAMPTRKVFIHNVTNPVIQKALRNVSLTSIWTDSGT